MITRLPVKELPVKKQIANKAAVLRLLGYTPILGFENGDIICYGKSMQLLKSSGEVVEVRVNTLGQFVCDYVNFMASYMDECGEIIVAFSLLEPHEVVWVSKGFTCTLVNNYISITSIKIDPDVIEISYGYIADDEYEDDEEEE